MERARLATWAELLHLETIWIITTVLLGDVVALFAIHAGHGDLGADIRALAGHRRTPYKGKLREEGYLLLRLFRKFSCSELVKLVAEAGFEPATQRL